LLDVLQFEIPPQWSEPFRVDPPSPFKIVPVPGETRRQLLVYPPRPIADKYELTIRGRVTPSASDRLRVPDVVLQRAQQMQRFVALPEHMDLQQITWEMVGLSRASAPPAVAGPTKAQGTVYQVTGDRFQATLKGVQRATSDAQVTLADVHVIWQPDGH